jgi:hypothetical protein
MRAQRSSLTAPMVPSGLEGERFRAKRGSLLNRPITPEALHRRKTGTELVSYDSVMFRLDCDHNSTERRGREKWVKIRLDLPAGIRPPKNILLAHEFPSPSVATISASRCAQAVLRTPAGSRRNQGRPVHFYIQANLTRVYDFSSLSNVFWSAHLTGSELYNLIV